jgi:O-antigen ligase
MGQLLHSSHKWIERNRLLWLRWLIPALVLLLAPAIGYGASPNNGRLLLLGLLGLSGAFVLVQMLLRWPGLGFVLLIPANMLVPFTIGTGTQTSVNATILLILLLLGLWLYELWQRGEGLRLYRSATIPPLALLIVVTILALLAGQLPWLQTEQAPLAAQIGGLAVFVLSAAAYLLAVHQYRELRWLEWTVWLLIALGTIYVGFRVIPGMFRHSGRFYQWGSVSSQFWTWFVALTFSQALLNQKLRREWRAVLLAILAVTLYSILWQTGDWMSGWIPPVIAMVAIVALRWWQSSFLLVIGGVVGLPVLLAMLIATDAYSYETRIDAWLVLLDLIRINPILGLGPANYYYYTPLFGIRGYYVQFNSHNQYFDMLLQTGVLGLACLLWFFAAVARAGWRLRLEVPDGFAYAYVYGALGGLAATAASGFLGDWILPFVYNVGIVGMRSSILGWLFLGGLIAIERMIASGALPRRVEAEASALA